MVPQPRGSEANRLAPEVVDEKSHLFSTNSGQKTSRNSRISGAKWDGNGWSNTSSTFFEKVVDEPHFAEMYAVFCRKFMERIDTNIVDPAVLNKYGQPFRGQLFRKYLLDRSQEEFERGWKIDLPPKPADSATGRKESEQLSEGYYAAKRRCLALVLFMGELFKVNMLIEKFMYALDSALC